MVCVWQVLRQREGVDVKRDAVLYPPGWALEDLASDNDVIPAEFLSKQPSSPIPSISARCMALESAVWNVSNAS
jgi:hypothetical protein